MDGFMRITSTNGDSMKSEDRQAVLTRAIYKAIEGGWYGIYKNGFTWPEAKDLLTMQWDSSTEKFTDGAIEDETTYNFEAIIFNHDFAKALWGERDRIDAPSGYKGLGYERCMAGEPEGYGDHYFKAIPSWQYHLQQMVIAADPIEYLANNM